MLVFINGVLRTENILNEQASLGPTCCCGAKPFDWYRSLRRSDNRAFLMTAIGGREAATNSLRLVALLPNSGLLPHPR